MGDIIALETLQLNMDGVVHYNMLQTLPYRTYGAARSTLNFWCDSLCRSSALPQQANMKFLKYILALLSIIFCLGEVYAQSSDFYADRIVVAQRRVNGRSVYDGTSVQPEKRQRRFATPANNTAYQERANRHQNGQPAIDDKKNGNKSTRMTKDERRALRQQINDANQGIYKKKRNRASNP